MIARLDTLFALHKYLYGNVDPVNVIDPSGYVGLTGLSVGMNISATLSRIAILGTRAAGVYAKVDTALTLYHARTALMRAASLLRKEGFDSTLKSDKGFANTLANSEEAIATLGANFGKIFSAIIKGKAVKEFIKNPKNDMLIYGPTPSPRSAWFPTGTRISLGKIRLGRSSRKIFLELGKGRSKGGRFTGLGHTQGKSKRDTQWFRMDWHKAHDNFSWEDGNYHFHAK